MAFFGHLELDFHGAQAILVPIKIHRLRLNAEILHSLSVARRNTFKKPFEKVVGIHPHIEQRIDSAPIAMANVLYRVLDSIDFEHIFRKA